MNDADEDETPDEPVSTAAGWHRVGQYVCTMFGLAAAGFAFFEPAPIAAVCAGLACFCGVLARIFQAEAHELVRRQ